VRAVLLAAKPPPAIDGALRATVGPPLTLGSLSFMVGHNARSYSPLPEWAPEGTPASVRDPPRDEEEERRTNKKKAAQRKDSSDEDSSEDEASSEEESDSDDESEEEDSSDDESQSKGKRRKTQAKLRATPKQPSKKNKGSVWALR
jgi:hypothetical protein